MSVTARPCIAMWGTAQPGGSRTRPRGVRAILAEQGLTLKDVKTRIVELREGGEAPGLPGLSSPLGAREHARLAASVLPGSLAPTREDAACPWQAA
jgi:hypothetical protein